MNITGFGLNFIVLSEYPFDMRKRNRQKLTELDLLAAEFFGYSYHNYENHLGNIRFSKLMPQDVKKMQRAEAKNWPKKRIAKELDVPLDRVDSLQKAFKDAKQVVFAANPSEAFRIAVKQCIKNALSTGLNQEEEIDDLVIQICFRASDMGYLLDLEGKKLSDYWEWLQREKDVDYSGIGLPNLE